MSRLSVFKNGKDLRKHIARDYEQSKINGKKSFYRVVQDPKYKGLPAGTACSIYHGKKFKKWWRIYGLSITQEVEVCHHCGIAHVRKTCPNQQSNTKRNRASINLNDPVSAMETITKLSQSANYIQQLADELASYLIRKTKNGK